MIEMLERRCDDASGATTASYVLFLATGRARRRVAFRCSACGYGVALSTVLPLCPMCGADGLGARALAVVRPLLGDE